MPVLTPLFVTVASIIGDAYCCAIILRCGDAVTLLIRYCSDDWYWPIID